VSGPGLFEGWLPKRELENLLAVGKTLFFSKAQSPVPMTPAAMLETAVQTAGERMLGRRVTVRAGASDVEMTLVEIDFRVDSVGLGQARMGDVRLVAEDVDVPDYPLERLTLVCRDVRMSSLPMPTLVAGSVEVSVAASAAALRNRVAELRPDILAEPGEDGYLLLRSAKRPRWGHLRVEPGIDDGLILLRPRALGFGPFGIGLPRWLRPITIPVPDLPNGLRLTGVEVDNGELILHGLADQWRERLSSVPLSTLLSWVTTAATTLTVPRLPKPR
jgi:hypothetical protein